MKKARLQSLYDDKIRSGLQQTLELKNVMMVPKLAKIVVNVGIKDAVTDSKAIKAVMAVVEKITGQLPVKTVARKSIAGFKLRAGMPIGVKVTLRGTMMFEFLDRLINLALPAMRDFQGVPVAFDKAGNYNLGIREWICFPEVDYDSGLKIRGMNISFNVTGKKTENGTYELLKSFGMPFSKN